MFLQWEQFLTEYYSITQGGAKIQARTRLNNILLKGILDPKGNQNYKLGAKEMTILLKRWILSLVYLYLEGFAPAACKDGLFLKLTGQIW